MNEVINQMVNRHSCKKYKDDPVPQELLDQIIDAGLHAANGMSKQSPIILCVTNKELRDRLSKLNGDVMGAKIDPFYNAPAVLIVLANKDVMTYLYDGSLVAGNMLNAADSLGLGACWIHRAKEVFESEEGKQILKDLGIEGNYEGIANVIVGYKNGEPVVHEIKENRVYYAK